ncbi:hypothetical protein MHYP_G00127940 [Metynnis hypsauchen]
MRSIGGQITKTKHSLQREKLGSGHSGQTQSVKTAETILVSQKEAAKKATNLRYKGSSKDKERFHHCPHAIWAPWSGPPWTITEQCSSGSVTEVAAWIITHQAHCGVGMLWACQDGLMRSSPTGLQQSVQH